MESPFYRANLELLNTRFPDKDILSIKDIAEFEGKHRTSIYRKYKMLASDGITKAEYAQMISIWSKLPDSAKRSIRKTLSRT